jgi:hypothetical protein
VVPARDGEWRGGAVPIKSCRRRGDVTKGGLYPGLDRFHGDKTRRSCFLGQGWRTVGGGHKAIRLFPGPTPTTGTSQQVEGGAARSPPGGRDTEGRQEFGGRSTLCGSCWDPARLHRPPPAARRIFFWMLHFCVPFGLGFPTHIDDVLDAARELPWSGPPRVRN